MILISTPRAGTEWFIAGLKDHVYSGFEILTTEPFSASGQLYSTIDLDTRLAMLAGASENRVEKIFTFDFREMFYARPNMGADLFSVLKDRTDLYWMERRSVRKQIYSFLVASINNNYHGDSADLNKSSIVPFHTVFNLYRGIVADPLWIKPSLNFKEQFVFEDLLSGAQVPQTLNWEPSTIVQERRSTNYLNCIQNLDEVNEWMDLLGVPA